VFFLFLLFQYSVLPELFISYSMPECYAFFFFVCVCVKFVFSFWFLHFSFRSLSVLL
jgi:hypothetical protein